MISQTPEQRLAEIKDKILRKKDSLKILTDHQLADAHLKPAERTELLDPFLRMMAELRKESASKEQPIAAHQQQEESKVRTDLKGALEKKPIVDLSKDKIPSLNKPELKLEVEIFSLQSSQAEKFLTIPNWEKGLENFLIHCQRYINESRLSLNLIHNKLSLAVLDINKKMGSNSNHEHNLELDPLPLYDIFPSFLWINFKYGDNDNAEKELDSWIQCVDPKNIIITLTMVGNGCFPASQTKTPDNLAFSRLLKIIDFFNEVPFAHFTPDGIHKFRDDIKKECAGFDYYADKIHEEFVATLTSSIYELPKGILFYGPPRTGKTHCSKKVIELLSLWRIHSDLAAGDFNKPLVGQSEQMVNKIVDRCDVMPWELCCLFIDEIDGLCPNRKGSGASSGKVDLISVFLSVMDGNKKKKNLMVIGTSNRLKYMDDAFLQRLDIKLFIGLPDVVSKGDWIKRIVQKAIDGEIARHARSEEGVRKRAIDYIKRIANFVEVEFKGDILRYTLNFTADAIKKSLAQIMTNAIQKGEFWSVSEKKELQEDLKELIYKSLNRICENDKIYISIFTPPELVKELENLNNAKKYNNVNWSILKKQSKVDYNIIMLNKDLSTYTQRMLIDLKEPAEERFQLEIQKIDKIGKSQVDSVQKIKNYLAKEADKKSPKVLDVFKDFKNGFAGYYSDMDFDYKTELERNPETAREFLEAFMKEVWPKILNEDKNNSIETFGITHDEFVVSKQDTLKILMKMADEAKINIIVVFDVAYFTKAGITNDEGMAQEILIATEEATQYDSCLVVFDLDSIADITKEYNSLQSEIKTASQIAYSNDKNDPQFAYSLSRKQAFRAALECLAVMPKLEKNHWFVAISNNNKLTLDFKEKVSWPATNQQKKIEKEIILNNVPKMCQHCFETYREKDNDPNACGRHSSSLLYDEDFINGLKAIHKDDPKYDPFKDKQQDLIYFTTEQVFQELKELNASRSSKHRLGRYKWVCCQKSFWEKGEIKAKHIAFTK